MSHMYWPKAWSKSRFTGLDTRVYDKLYFVHILNKHKTCVRHICLGLVYVHKEENVLLFAQNTCFVNKNSSGLGAWSGFRIFRNLPQTNIYSLNTSFLAQGMGSANPEISPKLKVYILYDRYTFSLGLLSYTLV